jgi:LuxR family quorum-sensing transcriptional regulator LasR
MFEHFVDLMSHVRVESWRERVLQLSAELGYERALLAILPNPNTPLQPGDAFLHSNYSEAWRSKYDSEKLEAVDPTVAHCATKSIPLIWTPDLFTAPKQQEMYEEARSHGLVSGVTLPIHGSNGERGMLCLASDRPSGGKFEEEAHRNLAQLSCFRDFILESSLGFIRRDCPDVPPIQLTQRELECLKWSATGKSSWDIGQILNCTEATVNFHFSNIRRKFGTSSRRQAVVKAIRSGIIGAL